MTGFENGEADGVTDASGMNSREKAIVWADAARGESAGMTTPL